MERKSFLNQFIYISRKAIEVLQAYSLKSCSCEPKDIKEVYLPPELVQTEPQITISDKQSFRTEISRFVDVIISSGMKKTNLINFYNNINKVTIKIEEYDKNLRRRVCY